MAETRIYVLPVSGNYFPIQLGLLCAVSSAYTILRANTGGRRLERPAIALGSSGGNLCAYVGIAADWERSRFYQMVDFFRSDLFLTSWYEHIPSWLFLPFSRSVYRPGCGFENLFRTLFTEGSLASKDSAEVWTGTCHRETAQQRLFVNREKGNTLLKPTLIDKPCVGHALDVKKLGVNIGANYPPYYAGNSVDVLAKASLASASIPWVVQPVVIDGDEYTDGGSAYASPLSSLSHDVYDISDAGRKKLALYYFSPFTLAEPRNVQSNIISDIENLIFSSSSCDIRIFIDLAVRLGASPPPDETMSNATPAELAVKLAELGEYNGHYAIVLFPWNKGVANNIDLANICPIEVRRVMMAVETAFGAFIWKAPLA